MDTVDLNDAGSYWIPGSYASIGPRGIVSWRPSGRSNDRDLSSSYNIRLDSSLKSGSWKGSHGQVQPANRLFPGSSSGMRRRF